MQAAHELSQVQLLSVSIVALGFLYVSWTVTRNLLFSPLRRFPGPKIAALTRWWDIYHTVKCDKFKVIHELHRKHGPVVRVGPNHLSFSSPETFRQVYVKGCATFLKDRDFYANIQPGLGPKYSGLFNYTNHQQSIDERKLLQAKLSPSALRQYELRFLPILDTLVAIMKDKAELDLFAYFKFLMLDAIGDLAFNQSFHQLESGEEHQYVIDFNNAFTLIGLSLKDAYYGLQRVFKYAQTRVDAFLSEEKPKPGTLMEAYLENGKPKPPYTPWYIALSGHGFIVAGSESTSITLTYVVWLLIKHLDIQRRLRLELKNVPPDATGAHLASLPLLDAVIKETLRIYPPAPSAMPRVVPSRGAEMEGINYPPNVRFQLLHRILNFRLR
ncbi:cytochrome P450 [Dactylonectria macrodidyma]|uniref:Cytochrome P450 n=1 Tax=Dactylonectria macrodidyma TaxID=307937 RepID=A0A9P9IS85_9HYPO|nr:cytochrome P450 [Dactylonectria macrodidyma]